MATPTGSVRKDIPAIRVRQWLDCWNQVAWDPGQHRAEPQHWFYQFSISAADLRALSGVYARTTQRRRGVEDLGIQRGYDEERSREIARFVEYGFPWSELSQAKRESDQFGDLRKPGWLPTAIVVNILTAADLRRDASVDKDDLVEVEKGSDGLARIRLPKGFTGPTWHYKTIPPIEVIDGQHRLRAFEDGCVKGTFELPVVAFVGLDLSWQAYLFYTINIKPKKINASLAFDLYPLLRTEDWLTKFEGHVVYREARAQELVDLLWSHPESPWHHRINMLGEKGFKGAMVTQAAWIRSLLASYIKSWEGRGVRIGGLFGAPVGRHETVLPWDRCEQAAFLITFGRALRDAVNRSEASWAKTLREHRPDLRLEREDDPALHGPHTLLNQDQGVRTLLQVSNDLCYVKADDLGLDRLGLAGGGAAKDEARVAEVVESLRKNKKVFGFLRQLAEAMATYDWRASSAPGLSDEDSQMKAAFRGSGGYSELRRVVLRHLAKSTAEVGKVAAKVLSTLKL